MTNQQTTAPTSACVFSVQDVALGERLANDEIAKIPFKGKANSGGVIQHAYWQNFAIDMNGLSINRQDLPVLRDHDPTQVLGYTTSIKATADGLDVEGYLVEANDVARETLTLMRAGTPLQMSVYVKPRNVMRLKEGQKLSVNGHEVAGPGHVFKEAHLREVTITALGADEATDATLLSARAGSEVSVSMCMLHQEQETNMSNAEQREEAPSQAPLDAAALAEQHPELFNEVRAQAQSEAMAAERERIQFALNKSRNVSPELVSQAIGEGWDRGTIAERFLDDVSEASQRQLAKLSALAPASVGFADSEAEEFQESNGKANTPDALLSDAELRHRFANDADLRGEFASADDYIFDVRNGGNFDRAVSLV